MSSIAFVTGGGKGKLTQTAGTRIQRLLGGEGNLFTHITNVRITTQGTAHVLTLMRGASRGKVTTALAAAGTALIVDTALTDSAGNAIAANDFIAVKLDNGAWHLTSISAWNSGAKTATLNTAIPTGRSVPAGAKVVCYGVAGDSGHADYQFDSGAGATNNIPAVSTDGGSICKASAPSEPIMLDIDNGTAASTLVHSMYGCSKV